MILVANVDYGVANAKEKCGFNQKKVSKRAVGKHDSNGRLYDNFIQNLQDSSWHERGRYKKENKKAVNDTPKILKFDERADWRCSLHHDGPDVSPSTTLPIVRPY